MRKEPYGLMPIFAHRCMHHEIYGKRLQYETYKSSQILHSINDTIDPSRFAAMFKREKGITPRECRRVRTDQLPEEKTIA